MVNDMQKITGDQVAWFYDAVERHNTANKAIQGFPAVSRAKTALEYALLLEVMEIFGLAVGEATAHTNAMKGIEILTDYSKSTVQEGK